MEGVKLSPETTAPVLVRQGTDAVAALNPVMMHDMVVWEPFFTSLFTA